jgi:hypothetical protein
MGRRCSKREVQARVICVCPKEKGDPDFPNRLQLKLQRRDLFNRGKSEQRIPWRSEPAFFLGAWPKPWPSKNYQRDGFW